MKNKKMDQADSFDLRPASVEEAGLFHPDGETLVGRVTFASGERQEFTDHGAYRPAPGFCWTRWTKYGIERGTASLWR